MIDIAKVNSELLNMCMDQQADKLVLLMGYFRKGKLAMQKIMTIFYISKV